MTSKPPLIILSDLHGNQKADWLEYYNSFLQNDFEITYYDCLELAEIDQSTNLEQNLHHQFINGGIDKAITNLLQIEKRAINILAFSIGGIIAWRATLLGLDTQTIFAISSTRLRMESEKPKCMVELFYGEKDLNRPRKEWFTTMKTKEQLFKNEDHEMYKSKEIAEYICRQMIQ